MSEFDPQSRFSLVETAAISPGVDFITKSPKGPFVDTHMSINKFDAIFAEANVARVYISVDTLREMAEGAGILDELRAEMLAQESKGYQIGYADAMKENLGGTLGDLAERIGALSARLDGGDHRVPVQEAGGGGAEEPLVLVTEGEGRTRTGEGEDQAAPSASDAGGQSPRPRGKRRPAGVSGGSGDGNPFRRL